MQISAKRMAALREHIRVESEHDMDTLIERVIAQAHIISPDAWRRGTSRCLA